MGGEPLSPHGNVVYDGLQKTGEGTEVGLYLRGYVDRRGYIVEVGVDRRGPKVRIATKGGCARSRENAILARTLYRASHHGSVDGKAARLAPRLRSLMGKATHLCRV